MYGTFAKNLVVAATRFFYNTKKGGCKMDTNSKEFDELMKIFDDIDTMINEIKTVLKNELNEQAYLIKHKLIIKINEKMQKEQK